ncbi:hypothetical protein RIF29_34138 [Crotalaria pallida]|uniref:Uncharacterized protein n=1 Tax=Crotalaria pallida TaxID=3830 RepID=A0AAN9EAV9_CROPI
MNKILDQDNAGIPSVFDIPVLYDLNITNIVAKGAVVGGWKEFKEALQIMDGGTITFKYLGMSRFRVDLSQHIVGGIEEEEEGESNEAAIEDMIQVYGG